MRYLFLCVVFFFVGCTSSSVGKVNNGLNPHDQLAKRSEHFIDWEYRGFGIDLPSWVEIYFADGVDAISKKDKNFFGAKQILVVDAYGENPDQTVRKLFSKITSTEIPATLSPHETLWVRFAPDVNTEFEYMALALYATF